MAGPANEADSCLIAVLETPAVFATGVSPSQLAGTQQSGRNISRPAVWSSYGGMGPVVRREPAESLIRPFA
jgi:hypothetical protein